MSMIRNFRDLIVWQKSHQLTLLIYQLTEEFPRAERYGLTSQIRRAAASTAATIVEGSSRKSTRDLCHFLNLSQGSNDEVKYFAILAHDLRFLLPSDRDKILDLTREIGAMLHALIQSLQASVD